MPGLVIPIEQRFFEKVVVNPNGCWDWIGAKIKGYGVLIAGNYGALISKHYKSNLLAHGYSFFRDNGYFAQELDHLCFNPSCVNPEHLEDVTHKENMRRADIKYGIRSARTECPLGHQYTQENTRLYRGRRNCIECARSYYKRNIKKG